MKTLITIVLVAAMMVISLFSVKKDRMREFERREAEDKKKRTMPNGRLVPEDGELLSMTNEELVEYKENGVLMWLINYISYKEIDATEEEKPYWRDLLDRATKVKTGGIPHRPGELLK